MKLSHLFHTLAVLLVLVGFAPAAMAQEAAPVAGSQEIAEPNVGTPAEVTAPAEPAAQSVATPASREEITARMQAKPAQLGMQEPASPVMERLFSFHNFMLALITAVTLLVLVLMIYVCLRFRESRNPEPSKTSHNTMIEVIWTLIPVLILAVVLVPSLRLLYYMDHSQIEGEADLTLKVVGYQWYWHYEYPEYGFAYDSYMVQDADLKEGQPRLLTVDNAVVVPVGKKVLVQLTAGDVIHSWAMPNFGVKMDAVPGRLNETWFEAKYEGTYYGQCSELCGVNHGFMPITVHVVSEEEFEAWVEEAKEKFASLGNAPLQLAAR